MSRTTIFKRAAASLADVGWRRLRGQPKSEHWPLGFAVVRDYMRRSFEAARDFTPQQMRASQERMADNQSSDLPYERRRETISGVDCEWFRPADYGAPDGRLLVYLHGGAYLFGSTNTHAETIGRLAIEADLPVVGVNYRLLPEHTIEQARDDVLAVWEALLGRGWSADAMGLAGDSAGGALAVTATCALRDADRPMPARLGLISPWIDLHCDSPSYYENDDLDYGDADMFQRTAGIVRGGRPADDPLISPTYADLSGFPPTLVHWGDGELMADDCRRFADKLEEAGVEVTADSWPDMVHAFHAFAGVLPAAEEALAEMGDFLV